MRIILLLNSLFLVGWALRCYEYCMEDCPGMYKPMTIVPCEPDEICYSHTDRRLKDITTYGGCTKKGDNNIGCVNLGVESTRCFCQEELCNHTPPVVPELPEPTDPAPTEPIENFGLFRSIKPIVIYWINMIIVYFAL